MRAIATPESEKPSSDRIAAQGDSQSRASLPPTKPIFHRKSCRKLRSNDNNAFRVPRGERRPTVRGGRADFADIQSFASARRAFTLEAQPLAASSIESHSRSCRSVCGESMWEKVPLSFLNSPPLVSSSL